jgi:O-antigen/teichoic acid export membrane protein
MAQSSTQMEGSPGVKRVAYNALWLFLNSLLRFGFTFVLYVVSARILGAAEYGRLNFALSLAALLSLGADLGQSDLLVREVASGIKHPSQLLGGSLVLRGTTSLFMMVVLYVVAIALGIPEAGLPLILIVGVQQIVALSLDSLAIAVLSGLEKMGTILLLGGANAFGGMALGVAALLLGFGAEGLSITTTVVILLHLLFTIVVLRRFGVKITRIEPGTYSYLIKGGMPFLSLGIATAVYSQLPPLILEQTRGNAELGHYSAAVKLGNFLNFLPAAVTGAIYPALSRLHAQGREGKLRGLEVSMRALWTAVIPLSLTLIFLAAPLISLILGKDYSSSQEVLPWVGIMIAFIFLNYPLFVYLNSIRAQTLNFWARLTGAIIVIGLTFVLVTDWGAQGVAIAVGAGELVMLLIVGAIVMAKGQMPALWKLLPPLAGGAAMGLVLWAMQAMNPVLAFAAGLAAYLVVLLLTGGLRKDDKEMIHSILKRA